MKAIWEIDERFFCPISGFCLSPTEQKAIVRKFVSKSKQQKALDRLHDFLISMISSESKIARYVQKILSGKYSNYVIEYKNLHKSKWMEVSESLVNSNDFGAYIWINAMYFKFSDLEINHIMHKIHMYSHDVLHEFQLRNKEYDALFNQYLVQEDKYSDIKHKLRIYDNDLKDQRSINTLLNSRINSLEKKIAEDNERYEDSDSFVEKINQLEAELILCRSIIEKEKQDNKYLSKKLNSQKSILEEIENDLHKSLKDLYHKGEMCQKCDKVNLCDQRVLIVGGITKMKTYYKKIVQDLGGQFQYHDGYCQQNENMLNQQINQSDIVICPVDVNSHAACLQVKKACKKTGTNFHMIRKSSISSIYNTLVQIANN